MMRVGLSTGLNPPQLKRSNRDILGGAGGIPLAPSPRFHRLISPTVPKPMSNRGITSAVQSSTLADVLERVLDKGLVIAGDISVSVASTELLSIRIRLLISSVDKARELGINWWEGDPYLQSQARQLAETNQQLQTRLQELEQEIQHLQQQRGAALPESATPPATMDDRSIATDLTTPPLDPLEED